MGKQERRAYLQAIIKRCRGRQCICTRQSTGWRHTPCQAVPFIYPAQRKRNPAYYWQLNVVRRKKNDLEIFRLLS